MMNGVLLNNELGPVATSFAHMFITPLTDPLSPTVSSKDSNEISSTHTSIISQTLAHPELGTAVKAI